MGVNEKKVRVLVGDSTRIRLRKIHRENVYHSKSITVDGSTIISSTGFDEFLLTFADKRHKTAEIASLDAIGVNQR